MLRYPCDSASAETRQSSRAELPNSLRIARALGTQAATAPGKAQRGPKPVVFEILRDAQCSECGAEMGEGSFLLMEAEQPLCLACAGFSDLEFLAAGNMALTRRATKHSAR